MQNPKNIVKGHLNVIKRSLSNKFDAVEEELVQNKIDICFLSETKIDETFSNQQFMIKGYKLFRETEIVMVEVLCIILMKICIPKLEM